MLWETGRRAAQPSQAGDRPAEGEGGGRLQHLRLHQPGGEHGQDTHELPNCFLPASKTKIPCAREDV